MAKPNNHKSLAEHIVDDLELKIFTGKLKPGQRIIEDPICEAFGVSRSPVRRHSRSWKTGDWLFANHAKGFPW